MSDKIDEPKNELSVTFEGKASCLLSTILDSCPMPQCSRMLLLCLTLCEIAELLLFDNDFQKTAKKPVRKLFYLQQTTHNLTKHKAACSPSASQNICTKNYKILIFNKHCRVIYIKFSFTKLRFQVDLNPLFSLLHFDDLLRW